jgi:predicted DNA-binding transcriptional regulator AlpA
MSVLYFIKSSDCNNVQNNKLANNPKSDATIADNLPRRKLDVHRERRAEARVLTDDPLLTVREAAAEVGIGVTTFWKWVKLGRFPQPLYPLPRSPRWRRSEVRAALSTGHGA